MELDETRVRRIAREEAEAVAEPVAEALWGSKRPDLEGGGRHNDEGLVKMVNDLHDALANGGGSTRISTQSFDRRTKIIGSVIAGVFALGVPVLTAWATTIFGG